MEVQRTEHKFILNRQEAARLIKKLDCILPRDKHSTSPEGYEVRSLYFDTLGDRSYFEKADGLEQHEKIRIRVYGCDDSVIKLESKKKNGQCQHKTTLIIDRALQQSLCAGHYSPLLELEDPAALGFYRKLSAGMLPKSIIQYRRISFSIDANNTRITFDSDIRSTESGIDILSPQLLTRPVLPSNLVVLEIKFNNFLLSYIRDALNDIRQSPSSYSKYANGRYFTRTNI